MKDFNDDPDKLDVCRYRPNHPGPRCWKLWTQNYDTDRFRVLGTPWSRPNSVLTLRRTYSPLHRSDRPIYLRHSRSTSLLACLSIWEKLKNTL